jgi:hypothetical protein
VYNGIRVARFFAELSQIFNKVIPRNPTKEIFHNCFELTKLLTSLDVISLIQYMIVSAGRHLAAATYKYSAADLRAFDKIQITSKNLQR